MKNRTAVVNEWGLCFLLVGIAMIGQLVLRSYLFINQDVAFLTWTADQVTGPPVYGRDILDVNPPMSILIYMPSVLLAHAIGFEWGIRVWMIVITAASLVMVWHTADKDLRLRVAIILLAFVLLAYPNHFAQREQIALLLCTPYVAGTARGKSWATVSGLMAGVGFLIKPHFLIPLLLVFSLRRRFGLEERIILAAGVAYGLALVIFFQPYMFEMVPMAAATYGAIAYPDLLWTHTLVIACLAGLMLALGAPQAEARPYLMAAVGFTAAAFFQQKGFFYHYIPAFAFLAMYTAVTLRNGRQFAAKLAGVLLLLQCMLQAGLIVTWLRFEAAHRQFAKDLKAEIDNSRSYTSLTIQPAGPQLIQTPSRFVGIAIGQLFLPAVISHLQGVDSRSGQLAERLAREQAIREIRNQPELVIVTNTNFDGKQFDVLGWLLQDATFRDLWKDYQETRNLRGVIIYRRK
jgi:hypothetical protein